MKEQIDEKNKLKQQVDEKTNCLNFQALKLTNFLNKKLTK
jgi:hypothetical protein